MTAGSPDLLDIAAGVVSRAREGEGVEAYVARSRSTEIRAYEGQVESLSSAESLGVGVRVVVDGRQGFAYAGSLEPAAVAEALDAARDNAEFASPDPWLVLAGPDDVAPAELHVFDPAVDTTPTEHKVQMALELEAALRRADSRITGIESADYFDAIGEAALASTTGIAVESRATRAGLSTFALATDTAGAQVGFGWSVGRGPGVLDIEAAAAAAATRATRMLGATKPDSTRCTVVLDPLVTSMFLGIIGSTLSGESVNKGRSLFAGRLDQEVASSLITLVDDPTDPDAFAASAFDGEGIASRRNVLIGAGTLMGYVHNASSAARAGTKSTGNAVRGGHASIPGVGCRALALAPGQQSPEDIYRSIGEGILIGSVSGLHSGVNPVSGDFSTGAEGVRIRNGELAEPVREFTIGSTLQRMLQDTIAVGSDIERVPGTAAGVSLAIEGVSVGGR